jgi:phosphate transport system substrate-binding protein
MMRSSWLQYISNFAFVNYCERYLFILRGCQVTRRRSPLSRKCNKNVLKGVECAVKKVATLSGQPSWLSKEETVHAFRIALFAMAAAAAIGFAAQAAEISGAGATFPYPIYAKWAEAYAAKTGTKLNYQSIGSGGGIAQINARTVDFGASDMPLKPDELEKNGLTQFPPVIGGEVLVVNLPGIQPGQMTLDGPTIANIYLGKITKWSDPAIAKLNPRITLPDIAIAVVHRSDGSGTTFIFTNYLSKVSPEWKDKVSEGTSIEWPVGLGGKGNEGVAALASRTAGAIGYVEYAYALQNKLAHTKLVNHDGAALEPGIKVFQAAAANADWKNATGFYLILTNQPGKETWPITGATFILMHKKQEHPDRAKEVLAFFDWAYKNGAELAKSLDYVPMPQNAVGIFEDSWKQILGPDGKPVWDGRSS